jgi:hypothetical protein
MCFVFAPSVVEGLVEQGATVEQRAVLLVQTRFIFRFSRRMSLSSLYPAVSAHLKSLKVQTAAAFVALMRDLGEETHSCTP